MKSFLCCQGNLMILHLKILPSSEIQDQLQLLKEKKLYYLSEARTIIDMTLQNFKDNFALIKKWKWGLDYFDYQIKEEKNLIKNYQQKSYFNFGCLWMKLPFLQGNVFHRHVALIIHDSDVFKDSFHRWRRRRRGDMYSYHTWSWFPLQKSLPTTWAENFSLKRL